MIIVWITYTFHLRTWFGATMSTGSLSIVLSETPNRFHGLETIGKVFFVIDIVLFVSFTGLAIARFIIVPKKLAPSLHHPIEGLFFGAYWVSVALLLNGIQIYGVPSCGVWLVKAMEIAFWIYSAIVVLVAVFLYYVLFAEERFDLEEAMPAWIFPIYPLLVIGPLAGDIIPSQPESDAYPMWVGALMLQGLAWTVALMMYTLYTRRLMSSALPSPSLRPGMFVSVGPAGKWNRLETFNRRNAQTVLGYTSAALISLATQAPKVTPAIAFTTTSYADGQVVKIIGILAGTFVLLFSFWFFCISTVAVIAGVKRMEFTLNWWAFVFPNAGLTLAAIKLGEVYKSPGVNGVCTGLTIALVILWLITAIAHVRAVIQKKILWPGRDDDQVAFSTVA